MNYKVNMADRCKHQMVFHVNMRYAPTATAYRVEEGVQDEMEEVSVWNTGVGQGGQLRLVSN